MDWILTAFYGSIMAILIVRSTFAFWTNKDTGCTGPIGPACSGCTGPTGPSGPRGFELNWKQKLWGVIVIAVLLYAVHKWKNV